MDITPDARNRLAAEMEARRLDLGLSWREVATRAGLSYEMVMKLRTRVTSARPLTLRKADAGLGWEAGSSERVLNGGEPVPATGSSGEEQLTPLDEFERRVAAANLPDGEKLAAIRRHRELAREQLAALGIGDPPEALKRAVRHLAGETAPASDEGQRRGA